MDYEKLHKDTITKLQEMVNSGKITVDIARGICADFVLENEDERIRKNLITCISTLKHPLFSERERKEFITWLEKQKACDEIKGTCGELNSAASKPIEFGPCEYWSDEETRLKLLFFIQTVGAAKLPLTSVNRYVNWIEKQGKKIVAIENFDTEFEKQVSCLIASSMNKEHESTGAFVKWA